MLNVTEATEIARTYAESHGFGWASVLECKRHRWLWIVGPFRWHFFVETPDGREIGVVFFENDPENYIYCAEITKRIIVRRAG